MKIGEIKIKIWVWILNAGIGNPGVGLSGEVWIRFRSNLNPDPDLGPPLYPDLSQ
jgi:hypothetical protein